MIELNIDGLIGPTHHYAGQASGNLASRENRGSVSNPRAAALQGLAKMILLTELGLPQAFLPPHERPCIRHLRAQGITGTDTEVLTQAWKHQPALLLACSSASAMWTANAATISPAPDTADSRTHLTPANLASQPHRRIEPNQTANLLRLLLPSPTILHHPPLSDVDDCHDEGGANHLRLAPRHGAPGLELFAYGRHAHEAPGLPGFLPRQTRQASEAVIRNHRLAPASTRLPRQHPEAIAAGAFHNDLVAVSNENLLLCHERAWLDGPETIAWIQTAWSRLPAELPLHIVQLAEKRLPLATAMTSYLFNSQVVSLPAGGMAVIAPRECTDSPAAIQILDELRDDPAIPVRELHLVDLRQSMRNGGGPACLRLRVVLPAVDTTHVNPNLLLDTAKARLIGSWIHRHYREELHWSDLADPAFLDESRRALDALTQLLHLGPIYDFQQ